MADALLKMKDMGLEPYEDDTASKMAVMQGM